MRDALRQVLPVDKFHHQRGLTLRSLDAVDVRDVRMIEGREQCGLTLEPRKPLDVAGN